MNTFLYHSAGSFHRLRSEACQDAVRYLDGDRYFSMEIADGVSSAENSAVGARLCCCAIEDFFRREQDRIWEYEPQKTAYLISEHILYYLEQNSNFRREDPSRMAATWAAVLIDKVTGKAMLLSLGDCGIYRISESRMKRLNLVMRLNHVPFQDTTKGGWKKTEVQQMRFFRGQQILLCTDGFWEEAIHAPTGLQLKAAAEAGNFDRCRERLEQMQLQDDCSFLAAEIE